MSAAQNAGCVYSEIARAKTGATVPLFADRKPANSLYNPEKDAEKAAARFAPETFAVFAGLADGRRIELFLAASPANECIVIEKNRAAFDFLRQFPKANAAMQERRALAFPLEEGGLKAKILERYIPALFRQFSLDILPSWQAHFPKEALQIKKEAEEALLEVSADFSTQALFGKVWMLNAAKNLYNAAKAAYLPSFNFADLKREGKKALIVAAGPSLDEAAPKIKEGRDGLVLFAADTALPALAKHGIAADFAVSIDPQAVSARHFVKGLSKDGGCAALILDICASPAAAERAQKLGCPVIFAAGGHPLSACMASFATLPRLETSCGTVTASALDAARRLGFKETATTGADFAYTGGKPYCRGTYLEDAFYAEATRLAPAEGMYAALMFRGPVTRDEGKGGAVTYKTDLLERYKKAVQDLPPPAKEWGYELEAPFPYKSFLFFYRDTLRSLSAKLNTIEEKAENTLLNDTLSKEEKSAFFSLLPLASFFRKKDPDKSRKCILKSAINLALNITERYTSRV